MTSATFRIFVCRFPTAFDNFITYTASNLELIGLRFYVPPDKNRAFLYTNMFSPPCNSRPSCRPLCTDIHLTDVVEGSDVEFRKGGQGQVKGFVRRKSQSGVQGPSPSRRSGNEVPQLIFCAF